MVDIESVFEWDFAHILIENSLGGSQREVVFSDDYADVGNLADRVFVQNVHLNLFKFKIIEIGYFMTPSKSITSKPNTEDEIK